MGLCLHHEHSMRSSVRGLQDNIEGELVDEIRAGTGSSTDAGERAQAGDQWRTASASDQQHLIALHAQGLGCGISALLPDHAGHDEQADQNGELQGDQAPPDAVRSGRLVAQSVEYGDRPKGGQDERRPQSRENGEKHDPYADPRQHSGVSPPIGRRVEVEVHIDIGQQPLGQSHAEYRRQHDIDERLPDELCDQGGPPRTAGFANGHLLRALSGSRGQEIDEVDTGNEQDEGTDDGGELQAARQSRIELRVRMHRIDGHEIQSVRGFAVSRLSRNHVRAECLIGGTQTMQRCTGLQLHEGDDARHDERRLVGVGRRLVEVVERRIVGQS